MPQIHSKSRQQAEIAFAKVRSQSLAPERAVEERDCIVRAREEKTLRLREARLGREVAATPALVSKRAR